MKTKNFLKKFAAIFFAASIFFTPLASAETLTYEQINPPVEKFIAELPAKKNYKIRKRPILIQGAMTAEVGKLMSALKNPIAYRYMNYVFVAGTYKDYPVVVSRTEIGIANAAVATAFAIEHFKPIAIINQGTAGGYAPNLHLNDIVIADKSINYTAYREDYSPAGEYDLTKQTLRGTYVFDDSTPTEFTRFPELATDAKLLQIAIDTAALNENWNVTVGTVGSADAWNNAIDHINFLRDNYGILCEEMETNSVAQVCYTAKVPFIGIRVISDNTVVGEKFDLGTALNCQDFALLVTENLIRAIKGGRF